MRETIDNFDPEYGWDPTVELMSDGDLEITFPEFPPPHLEEYILDFEKILSDKIGVKVDRQDREFFVIYDASEDTYHKTIATLNAMRAGEIK